MAFFRIIFFLLLLTPAMLFLSGCYDDTFLSTMKGEEDFVAPYDVVLKDDDDALRTTYFKIPDISTSGNYTANPNGETDNVVLDKTTGLMWTRCSSYEVDPDATPNSGDEFFEMDKTSGCTQTPKTMEWIRAAEFCKKTMNGIDSSGNDTLPHYAGYNDWRLPRIPELMSLLNFTTADPAIDSTSFPNTINATDGGYWTFTSKLFIGDYYETIDHGWIVFFKSAWAQSASFTNITDFRRKLKTDLTFEKKYVRCVRGGIKDPL